MKKISLVLLWITIIGGIVFSCTKISHINVEDEAVKALYKNRDSIKWVKEDSLKQKKIEDSIKRVAENKRLYELYLQDLREYKKTKHPIMFGWFSNWNPDSPDKVFQLDLIPDSVDMISIWGGPFNLSDKKKEQLRNIQSKGTKVIIGWIVENVGDQINWDKTFWPDDPQEAVKAYAKAIVDSINKYGYDGFDIDYEPSYRSPFKPGNHCGDWSTPWTTNKALISCSANSNKELENLFFKTLRELLGPDKILNINGSIDWLSPSMAQYFNYFVVQSYHGTYSGWTNKVMNRLESAGVKRDRIIYTETFQTNPSNRRAFPRYANFVVNTLRGEAGGIGAFHINEDVLDNSDFQNVRAAISLMNPPIK